MKKRSFFEKIQAMVGMRNNTPKRTRKYTRYMITKYGKTLRKLSYE